MGLAGYSRLWLKSYHVAGFRSRRRTAPVAVGAAPSAALRYAANATHAIETGTLFARGDHHLTHAFNIGEEGWAELTTAYMELFERVYEIQRRQPVETGRATRIRSVSSVT
jgi:hypothetical protein